MNDGSPTRTQVLDEAQELAQTRGYNAFSYRDLAHRIGIKTSSIHYYFPAKEDLGTALVARYRTTFKDALTNIDAQTDDPLRKIASFAELFVDTLLAGRICLCGMLATDFPTLPEAVQQQVQTFFSENELWLEKVLKNGRDQGALHFKSTPKAMAKTIFSTLEGAMIAARLFNDDKRLRSAADWVQDALSGNL